MDGVYFEHTQKCYLRITVEASWEEARSKCQLSSNGDLASLSDSYWFLFNNYFDWNFPDYWVGGERVVDGDWRWSDGSKWKNVYWAKGQPNESEWHNAAMYIHNNHTYNIWYDGQKLEQKQFIRQYSL